MPQIRAAPGPPPGPRGGLGDFGDFGGLAKVGGGGGVGAGSGAGAGSVIELEGGMIQSLTDSPLVLVPGWG